MLATDLLDVIVNGCGLHGHDLASLRLASTTLKAKVDQTLLVLRPTCDLRNLRLVPSTFRVLSCFDMSTFDLRLLSSSQLLASSGGLTRHLALTLSQLPCLAELVISEAFAREMGRKCWAAAVCNSIFKDVVVADPQPRQKQAGAVAPPAAAPAQPLMAAPAEASSSSSIAGASPASEAQEDNGMEADVQQGVAMNSLPSGLSSEYHDEEQHQQRWHSEEEQEELLCHVLNPGPSCLLDCPRELMWSSGFRTFDVVQFRISPASPRSSSSQSLSPTPASCTISAVCDIADLDASASEDHPPPLQRTTTRGPPTTASEDHPHTNLLPAGEQQTPGAAGGAASDLQQQLLQLCWPDTPLLLDGAASEDPEPEGAAGEDGVAHTAHNDGEHSCSSSCSSSCMAAENDQPQAVGIGALPCCGAWGRSESSASCGLLTVQGSFIEQGEAGDPAPGTSAATTAAAEPHTPRRQHVASSASHLQPAAPPLEQSRPELQQLADEEDFTAVQQEPSDLVYFHSAAEDPHANMSAVLWLPDWAATMPRLTSLRIRSDASLNSSATFPTIPPPGPMVAGSMTTLLWARKSALARVRSIDLCGTRLGVLPADLLAHCLPRTLRCLRLAGCGLSAIPTSVGSLVGLRELDVASNALRQIPEQLAQLTALSALDLSNNLLTALPACIGACTSLERLALGGNQLRGPSALPLRELAALPLLSCLVLSHNWLALPDALSSGGEAAAGRHLQSAAAARSICATASQLPEHLGLSSSASNWLGQLLSGPAASSLTRLELVNIGPWDQTVRLPWDACLALTKLEHLDLSQNSGGVQLGPAPSAYRPQPALQAQPAEQPSMLSSTAAEASSAPYTAEPCLAASASRPMLLPALRYLDISQCGLEELPEVISLLPDLRYLDVHNNCLVALPAWMPCLTALHQLSLTGNTELKLHDCDTSTCPGLSKWLQSILLTESDAAATC